MVRDQSAGHESPRKPAALSLREPNMDNVGSLLKMNPPVG
jgi:hypothetical protein